MVEKKTLRQISPSVKPSVYSADDVRKLRNRLALSQPVFANYLNVSESTVQKWESGRKTPSGAASTLLRLVDRFGIEILEPFVSPTVPAGKYESHLWATWDSLSTNGELCRKHFSADVAE